MEEIKNLTELLRQAYAEDRARVAAGEVVEYPRRIAVFLPQDLVSALDAEAKRTRRSRSVMMEDILRRWSRRSQKRNANRKPSATAAGQQ